MRVFPDDAGFCPADGTSLQHASMVPIANTDNDPRLGSRLCNRYELRRVVADGGMGRVYEGIDKQTQTRVAVKVLHDDVSKDDVSLERFKREYEISSQLPHDYIVKVMDFQRDESSGVWLLVMEFLDGEELRFILKREKSVEPARLVRMLAQTAIGLDEAHGRQFVHRDLKPDNLFLCGTREGDTVKILDFGSVKDKNKDAKKLTVLGTTIGSPYYMAPEQAQGLETLDARADVFALAAITYECMAGTVPFTGNNGPSILLAILTKDPEPVSKKGASSKYPIPVALDDVLEEALAKNPNIRTKSVGDFATQVGHAYGLAGDHKAWARVSAADLAREIAESAARAPVQRLEAAADPFAAPDPFAARPTAATAPMSPPLRVDPVAPAALGAQQPQSATNAGSQSNRNDDMADAVAGMPSGRPPWLIAVVVGVAALVVGGGIAFVALSR
jgi:serine/threonine-protein kinase